MAPVAGSAANVAGAEPSVGLPSPAGLESSPTLVCSQILASAFTLPSLRALQSMPVVTVPAALAASVALAALALPLGCAAFASSALAGGGAESCCAALAVWSAGAGGDCGGCAAGACVPSSIKLSNCEPFAWSELGAARAGFGSVGLNEYVFTSDATCGTVDLRISAVCSA